MGRGSSGRSRPPLSCAYPHVQNKASVCRPLTNEYVSSWERRRPSHPSVLDSVRRVLGDPPSFMLVDVTAPGFGSDDDTVLLVLPSHSATGPC